MLSTAIIDEDDDANTEDTGRIDVIRYKCKTVVYEIWLEIESVGAGKCK